MDSIGRLLIVVGIVLILVGGALYVSARLGLPLGRLPGDIHVGGEGGGFYFPVVTCLVVSTVLTIVVNLILGFLHK